MLFRHLHHNFTGDMATAGVNLAGELDVYARHPWSGSRVSRSQPDTKRCFQGTNLMFALHFGRRDGKLPSSSSISGRSLGREAAAGDRAGCGRTRPTPSPRARIRPLEAQTCRFWRGRVAGAIAEGRFAAPGVPSRRDWGERRWAWWGLRKGRPRHSWPMYKYRRDARPY